MEDKINMENRLIALDENGHYCYIEPEDDFSDITENITVCHSSKYKKINKGKMEMKCQICKSDHVNVQAVIHQERYGLLECIILSLLTLGIFDIYLLINGRRVKTYSIGVCQDCGANWNILQPAQVMKK